MDKLSHIAVVCVGRAVMFGALAIALIMLSFAFHPAWAFRAGAIMTLGMAAILAFKAQTASRLNPRKTEVWIYLDKSARPQNPHALNYFASTMREVYARFAQGSLGVACGMFVVSVILSAAGVEPYGHQAALAP